MINNDKEKLAVLNVIYEVEVSQISVGVMKFIPISEISKRLNFLSSHILIDILKNLHNDKLIILIDNEISLFDTVNNDEKFFVRSRIGHILWCLINSKQITNYDKNNWKENVSDLKYIKILKQKPKCLFKFSRIKDDPLLINNLHLSDLDTKTGYLLTKIIDQIDQTTDDFKINNFQYDSLKEIFMRLSNTSNKSPDGLTIVAEAGAGKSFAYQLPLILWILVKKITIYNEMALKGLDPITNCSALLLFPRNVLIYDQMHSLQDKLLNPINTIIENHAAIDIHQRQFLKIKIGQDFGGIHNYKSRKEMFEKIRPDIIVTHAESLKKRLYDPISASYYKEGIDMILYDEIHLYDGIYGGLISGLNARLTNLILTTSDHRSNIKPPLFVGMSATIDKPDKHCQKLFALPTTPSIINDEKDEKEEKTVEHHIMIKPRLGRPPMGVLIDCISCLIHNRRDSLDSARSSDISENERKKSITFIDSLDGTSRLTYDLNDLELFDFPQKQPEKYKRNYPLFFNPNQRYNENLDICKDCRAGWFVSDCTYYKKGICWYFSKDDASRWKKPISNINTTIEYPTDSIRSKRITSQEITHTKISDDIYAHFTQDKINVDGQNIRINEKIDNLVATNSLEVGVDYEGISEVILYGDISSPASYKQESGRGAREGNLVDGLVVMTVIRNTPLSNFYFKHFEKLVNPQMVPIRLETNNPNILKMQCFTSIFDYFARNGIDLYKLPRPNDLDDKNVIIAEYDKALKILNARNDLVLYLKNFLLLTNSNNFDIIDDAIFETKKILSNMMKKITLSEIDKPLILHILSAVKGNSIIRDQLYNIGKKNYDDYINNIDKINQTKNDIEHKLNDFETYINSKIDDATEFCEIINQIRRCIY